MKKICFILIYFFYSTTSIAQDAVFGLPNSAYIYTNPAFSGTSKEIRFNNIYKNQHSLISGNYNTNFLSFDLLYKGHGLGGYFLIDGSGSASLRKSEFVGIYSQSKPISDKISITYALSAGLGSSKLNFNNSIFEDQLNNDFTISEFSQEENYSNSKIFSTINFGTILYSENFWGGLSIHNINRAYIYNFTRSEKSNRKYSLQIGYVYFLKNNKILNKNSEVQNKIIYTLETYIQGNRLRTSLAAKTFYNSLIINTSLSNINYDKLNLKSVLLGIGYNFEFFTFNYGYEFYLSNNLKIGGAHELQVNIALQNNNLSYRTLKLKKSNKTFCPLK